MMSNRLSDEEQLEHLSVEYHDLKGNQIKTNNQIKKNPTMVNACEWWRTIIALEWQTTKMMINKNILEQWTMVND